MTETASLVGGDAGTASSTVSKSVAASTGGGCGRVCRNESFEETPSVLIQPDWNESIVEGEGGKVWVSVKEPGKPGCHYNILFNAEGSLEEVAPLVGQIGFDGRREGAHNLRVKTTLLKEGESESYHYCFLSPSAIFNLHAHPVISLDITADGIGVSGDFSGCVKIWDTGLGAVRHEFQHPGGIYRTKFFPSGKVVLTCGSDIRLRVWDAESGLEAAVLEGHTGAVTDEDFIGRGKEVVSCSKDGSAVLWDIPTQRISSRMIHDQGCLNCLVIDKGADENVVLVGSEEGRVIMADLRIREGGSTVERQGGSAVNAISYLNSNLIGIGLESGTLEVFDRRQFPNGPIRRFSDSHSAILSLQKYADTSNTSGGGSVSGRSGSTSTVPTARLLISRRDGTVTSYESRDREGYADSSRISLTGPDCDAVSCVRALTSDPIQGEANGDRPKKVTTVFTACRDKAIRKYRIVH